MRRIKLVYEGKPPVPGEQVEKGVAQGEYKSPFQLIDLDTDQPITGVCHLSLEVSAHDLLPVLRLTMIPERLEIVTYVEERKVALSVYDLVDKGVIRATPILSQPTKPLSEEEQAVLLAKWREQFGDPNQVDAALLANALGVSPGATVPEMVHVPTDDKYAATPGFWAWVEKQRPALAAFLKEQQVTAFEIVQGAHRFRLTAPGVYVQELTPEAYAEADIDVAHDFVMLVVEGTPAVFES